MRISVKAFSAHIWGEPSVLGGSCYVFYRDLARAAATTLVVVGLLIAGDAAAAEREGAFVHAILAASEESSMDAVVNPAVAPGCREIRVRPLVLGDLTHASASIRTVRGIVGVDWERGEKGLIVTATIPVTAQARIGVWRVCRACPVWGLDQCREAEIPGRGPGHREGAWGGRHPRSTRHA